MKRLSRAEQNERNRALVLDAARRVFLNRGYHAATLDEIADEAGFSRGVVQSRFGNKADLFLALLEERIAERAAQNARLAEGLRRRRDHHAPARCASPVFGDGNRDDLGLCGTRNSRVFAGAGQGERDGSPVRILSDA